MYKHWRNLTTVTSSHLFAIVIFLDVLKTPQDVIIIFVLNNQYSFISIYTFTILVLFILLCISFLLCGIIFIQLEWLHLLYLNVCWQQIFSAFLCLRTFLFYFILGSKHIWWWYSVFFLYSWLYLLIYLKGFLHLCSWELLIHSFFFSCNVSSTFGIKIMMDSK